MIQNHVILNTLPHPCPEFPAPLPKGSHFSSSNLQSQNFPRQQKICVFCIFYFQQLLTHYKCITNKNAHLRPSKYLRHSAKPLLIWKRHFLVNKKHRLLIIRLIKRRPHTHLLLSQALNYLSWWFGVLKHMEHLNRAVPFVQVIRIYDVRSFCLCYGKSLCVSGVCGVWFGKSFRKGALVLR
jgi:hypothetical protein